MQKDQREIDVKTLIKEYQQIAGKAHDHHNSATIWSHLYQQFLRKLIALCLECPGDGSELNFAVCIAGHNIRALGSPLRMDHIFVVFANDAKKMQPEIMQKLARFEAILKQIALQSGINFMTENPQTGKVLLPSELHGTIEELQNKISQETDSKQLNAIVSGVHLYGHPALLVALQTTIHRQPVKLLANHHNDVSKFYYYLAAPNVGDSLDSRPLNIDQDLISPLLAIIEGLKCEFNIYTLTPEAIEIIRVLVEDNKINEGAARLFVLALERLQRLRWSLDMRNMTAQEMLSWNIENRNGLIELAQVVRTLQETAVNRFTTKMPRDVYIFNGPSYNITKKEYPALRHIIKMDEIAFIHYMHIELIAKSLTPQGQQLCKSLDLFNEDLRTIFLQKNSNEYQYFIDSFFKCIDHNTGAINTPKFKRWYAALVRHFACDLFDPKGELKPGIQEILNRTNDYSAKIQNKSPAEVEEIKQKILKRYVLNGFYVTCILRNERYLKLIQDNATNSNHIALLITYLPQESYGLIFKERKTIEQLLSLNYFNSLTHIQRALKDLCDKVPTNLAGRLPAEREVYERYFGARSVAERLPNLLAAITQYLNDNHDRTVPIEVYNSFLVRIQNAGIYLLRAELKRVNSVRTDSGTFFSVNTVGVQRKAEKISELVGILVTTLEDATENVETIPAPSPINNPARH